MAITSQPVLPIDVLFVSRVGFSGTAELMVQLSNFKNPRWRYTRTAVIHNPCVSWAFLFQSATVYLADAVVEWEPGTARLSSVVQ